MGVYVTDDEANAVVEYYDLDGTGEMSYEVRCPKHTSGYSGTSC